MMSRSFLCLIGLAAVFSGRADAANTLQDFEGGAAAPYNWQVGTISQGEGGWFFTPGTSAEVSTVQSASGAQSLKFTSAMSATEEAAHSTAIAGTGARFVDVALLLPVAQMLAAGDSPDWLPTEAQLVVDSLPMMLAAPAGSSTAQLYLLLPTPGEWIPVGPPLDIDITARQLKKWLRLTVRTDATVGSADVWMNGKLLMINHPLTALQPPAVPALSLGLAPNVSAYLDDFAFGNTNPLSPDADHDAISDLYEYENGLNASADDRSADHDGDGLDNITEYWLGTKSNHWDSDGDEMPDVWEFNHRLNPLTAADANIDSDRDGATNLQEYNNGVGSTDPNDYTANNAVTYIRANVPTSGVLRDGTRAHPLTTLQEGLNQVASGGRIVLLGSPVSFTLSTSLEVLKPVSFLGLVENGQVPTITGTSTSGGFAIASDPGPPPVSNPGPVIFEDLSFFGFAGASSLISSNQIPLEISRCAFENCSTTATGGNGGAISVNGGGNIPDLRMMDCAFRNCLSKASGGGVYALLANVDVQRCRFLQCQSKGSSTAPGDGTAIYFGGCTGSVVNCLMHGGTITAGGQGQGAVACKSNMGTNSTMVDTTVTFKYCTILSNKASTVTGYTAGLYNGNATGPAAITLNSCILWDNKLNSNAKSQLNGSTSIAPLYTSLWSPTYCKFDALTAFGTNFGNNTTSPPFITGTPCLSSAATSSSHALAGDPASPTGMQDLDGTIRSTAPYERGCYEFADTDTDGMANAWEVRNGFNPNDKADALLDFDQDGYSNFEEYQRQSDPTIATPADTSGGIYLDPGAPPDSASQATFDAPAKSLKRAFELLTTSRNRILLREGTYKGADNRDRSVLIPATTCLIKAINPNHAVTIDLEKGGRCFSFTNASVTSYGYTTIGQLTLSGLTIRNGQINGPGGAIYHPSGPSGLTVSDCRFIACAATEGGAIYDVSLYPTGSGTYPSPSSYALTLTSCEFFGCEAGGGGAIFCNGDNSVSSTQAFPMSITASTFGYNSAVGGGAILVESPKGLSLSGCVFFRNQATQGGAVEISNATVVTAMSGTKNWLENCTFTENIASASTGTTASFGGALALMGSNTDVHNCRFTANTAAGGTTNPGSGGAVYIAGYTPKIFGSVFSANEASNAGGAVILGNPYYSEGGTPVLANCAFKTNLAGVEGGAIATATATAAPAGYGAPFYPSPTTTIAHCTLVWNRAPLGTSIYHRSTTNLYDSLIWFNSDGTSSGGVSLEGTATLTVAGNNLPSPSTGNISILPTLAFDNFHLAGPLPPTVPTLLGTCNSNYLSYLSEAYPSSTTSGYYPQYYDIDLESRYTGMYGSSYYTMEAGCDEWQDTDNDGLPDWFENYIIKYSGNDGFNSMAMVQPSSIIWANHVITLQKIFSLGVDPLDPNWENADDDQDGLTNRFELEYPSQVQPNGQILYLDPHNSDSDDDGFPDGWEERYKTASVGYYIYGVINPLIKTYQLHDYDKDGLSNIEEYRWNTSPLLPDTDNDNLADGIEVALGTDPNLGDTDEDGLLDGEEFLTFHTDPLLQDSDNDELTDWEEIYSHLTNPNNPDTDGDGYYDGFEIQNTTDPKVIDSHPAGNPPQVPNPPPVSNPVQAPNPPQVPPPPSPPPRPQPPVQPGLEIVGESRWLRYNYYHKVPEIGELLTSASDNTSGMLAETNSWQSGHVQDLKWNSHTSPLPPRLEPSQLTDKFTAQFPESANCANRPTLSAQGYFNKQDGSEAAPGSVNSDDSYLEHRRVVFKLRSDAPAPITFTLLRMQRRQKGPGEWIDDAGFPKSEEITLAPGGSQTFDLTPSFEAYIGQQQVWHSLLPIDLAVDNNRDGNLALGSGPDQTTEQKPYRFWLNNDDDTGWLPEDTYIANKDNPWTPGVVDSLDDKIKEVRDLEDFARIHLKVDSLHSQLAAGTMTLGLKWKTVQSGAPKIRLFKAVETDGGTKYLSDSAKAADQVSASTSSLGIIQGSTVLDLPVSFWTSTASSATKYFLFEATAEGKGELTMVFKQGTTVLGEGGSIFLDLLDIRKMYEQRGIAAAVIPDPDVDVLGTISGVTAVSYQEATHAFQPAWDENLTDKDYVICVHGWRKGGPTYAKTDPRYYKGRSDEITIFKRLWHRGFKGRYIGFIWPTYDVEVYDSSGDYDGFNSAGQSKFPQSEYRAWKCGQAFADFANSLPSDYKRKIIAHSLGNVVVGSALEKGLAMSKYAALNAAIPAYCYHAGAPLAAATLIVPPPVLLYQRPPDPSFDVNTAITALTYRGDTSVTLGKARLESVAGDIVNFYLPNDEALGSLGWEVNQAITPVGAELFGKPISSYEYERPPIGANEFQWDPIGTVNRKVTDPHEVMAMINTSRSYALGTQSTGGKISSNVDMSGVGMAFDKEHEAVFKWGCAKTWVFYSKLWDELNLAGTKAP